MKNILFTILMTLIVLSSSLNVASVYANNPTGNIDIINATSPNGRVGQTLTVGFTLQNKGPATSVNFSSTALTGPQGATIPISNIVFTNPTNIEVGTPTVPTTKAITFTVNVPSNAVFGNYNGIITVTDVNTPSTTATLPYTVSVTQGVGIQIVDLSNRDLTVLGLRTLQRGELNDRHSFKIKNGETTPLTVSFNVPTAQYTDNDGDIVDIRFTPSNPTIQANSEVTVQVTFDVPEDQELKRYTGTMTASTQNNQFSDTLEMTFDVVEDICSDGVVGNALSIDVQDPDNNDKFKPGETVDITVNVDNNGDQDYDVTVEAFLLDESGDELESEDGGTENLDENDDFDFEFSLNIPSDPNDVDDGDILTLFIKAFDDDNENEQCIVDSVDLKIELEDDDVELESATLTPAAAICGETVGTVVKVKNIGGDDQDDVFITVKNAVLNIREVTERFTLKEFKDDEDAKATKRLEFVVPPTTKEGSYPIDVEVTYGSGETVSDTVFLAVGQCSKETPSEEVPTEEPTNDGNEEETTPTETPSEEDNNEVSGSTTFLPTSRLFGNGASTAFWVIADIVLIVLALYFIILIFKKRRD
ncbi:MAG TPA: putative S-layer protein [Candidatus Nanoarchaeia archaeon]|nr:putative S-layer protein [Candidatus Woesearchaeota archaeon]HLC55611.1 putative S-layer protein [Candidatus Nanoarchaeia archaeon]